MQEGDEVIKSAIYSTLKKRLLQLNNSQDVFAELNRLETASVVYEQILGLNLHSDDGIQKQLLRLRRWEITTAYPFILKLLLALDQGTFTNNDVITCLKIIESFAVRRTICAVPTNQLKRIFLSVTKDLPVNGNIAEWLQKTLTVAEGTSGRRWPKDEEFKDCLLRYQAYSNPIDRCKFILETIEESYGHKEPASYSKATIEHIMPQTLNREWREELGDDADNIHERWLNLIGNLTLTGYNSQLSNFPFENKRKKLADSHFVINDWIASQPHWRETELQARTLILFERAIKIWARP